MSRDFLSRLGPSDQALLDQIGEQVVLEPRQHLMRRGEEGGDVFRVDRGELEVIDSSSRPEVILDRVGQGEILGELAFVDGTPRSADVVANGGCVVTRWPRTALEGLIAKNPTFAASFWRALAEAVSVRLRVINKSTTVAGKQGAQAADGTTDSGLSAAAHALGSATRDELSIQDRELRRDPSASDPVVRVAAALDALQGDLEAIAREHAGREDLAKVGKIVGRETLPLLLQATTVHLAVSHAGGHTGGPPVLAHLVRGVPSGDSPLGRAIDAWFLSRPLACGIRSRVDAAVSALGYFLATLEGPLRILLVNAVGSGLAARIHATLAGRTGALVVVETSRELVALGAGEMVETPGGMRIQYVQDDLSDLREGRTLRHFRNQDLVVLDGVFEYLPANLAIRGLQHFGGLLSPQGRFLATGLLPSPDAILWDHVLDWPTIRRSPGFTRAIASAAGYRFVTFPVCEAAGMVLLASNSATRLPRENNSRLAPRPASA